MVTQVRTSVHNSTIAGFTLRVDGMVRRYMRSLTREVVMASKLRSPRRTGRMAASITDKHQWANQHGTGRVIRVGVPYAGYVMGGTTGPITAGLYRSSGGRFSSSQSPTGRQLAGRKWMPVGKSQGRITNFAKSVRGQAANPFVEKALRSTMHRWGIL